MEQNLTGNSDRITREYFDSLLVEMRHIDSKKPDTSFKLYGECFDTPIMTAALSHLNNLHDKGMVEMAKGAKMAGAVTFAGMGDKEELEEMNDDLRIASYAVKIAKGKMEMEEKMKYFEKLGKLFNIVSDEAKDLALVYTGVNAKREEVMENGFDEIWEFFRNKGREDGKQEGISIGKQEGRKEGISIGEKRGISIGENKGILKCILGFQKKANCSFEEAADAIGVSKETLEQIKDSGLV